MLVSQTFSLVIVLTKINNICKYNYIYIYVTGFDKTEHVVKLLLGTYTQKKT